jgi:ribosomal protein S18 acetylase RimI-like enzyme
LTISTRPYQTEADYAAIHRLVTAVLGRAGPPVYATVGDIDFWRASDDDPNSVNMIQLWFDDARPVALAWPVDDQVDIIVHPDYPALHDAALAWAEAEYRQRQGKGVIQPLRAWGFTGDTARNAALAGRGYRRTEDGLVFYIRPVVAAAETPGLPAGYTFDHTRGEADLARRTAVHRAAFESSSMTESRMRAIQAASVYRPELDLVVVAPDSSFAAFALIWLDEVNHVGVFEPVGVSSAHRRMGLGRAILEEGLRLLGELDARIAFVQTGIQNHAAQGLYVAVGFTELDRNYAWTRATH